MNLFFYHNFHKFIVSFAYFFCLFVVFFGQMRVPSSPNQSANPPTPWETEPVVEETGIVEDANVENLYLMGWYLAVNQRNNLVLTKTANPENDLKSNTSS